MNKSQKTQEYRQNPISKEWVIISATRSKRPNNFKTIVKSDSMERTTLIENPFQAIVDETASNEVVNLVIRDAKGAGLVYNVDNKFPILTKEIVNKTISKGPYKGHSGFGKHELFVYQDLDTPVRDFSTKKMVAMFEAFQKRSLELMQDRGLKYIFLFHNHGRQAGSTLMHPHSQLIASPVIPDGIERILNGSESYYRSHKQSIFSIIVDYERRTKKRLIYENEDFIVYCPYASSSSFEIEIMPKEHNPHFAFMTSEARQHLARIYKKALKSTYQVLGEVDYNMYIYTAPCDGKDYQYFRWYIKITPRVSVWGGYESGADMDVCGIFPEDAAKMLSKN